MALMRIMETMILELWSMLVAGRQFGSSCAPYRLLAMAETQPDIPEIAIQRICSACVREPFQQDQIQV
jgi:hypothetical protein